MDEIELKAHGKINLSLDVLSRREDGYHNVKMIMQSVALHDTVFLKKEKERGIRLSCNLSSLPTDEGNLMVRAAKLMQEEFSIPDGIGMRLHKRLPVAAGMAGGSSDAAAVFLGLNQLFHLGLSVSELERRAVKLGADIPFCLHRGCFLSEGIGEKLQELPPLPPCHIILAKPAFSLSTKLIYENLHVDGIHKAEHPDVDRMIQELKKNNLEGICHLGGNILERVSLKLRPEIRELKNYFTEKGALLSLMSGSGPTVFAIFPKEEEAKCQAILEDLKNSALNNLLELSCITAPC